MSANPLSIGKKIWLIISILIIGYLISMMAGYYQGLTTERKLEVASKALFPATLQCGTAVTAFEKQIKGYNDAILMGEEGIFKMTENKSDEVRRNLTSILQMPEIDETLKNKIAQTISLSDKFTQSAQQYYKAISLEETEMDDRMGKLAAQTKEIQTQLLQYKEEITKAFQKNLDDISTSSKEQRMMNIWLFLGVVTISTFSAWFIVNHAISRPIRITVAMLRDIAEGEGDLTKRLDIKSRDEMGDVAKWFNTFIENLQTIIREFAQNAAFLNKASDDLVGLSGQMSDEARNMSSKSDTVAISTHSMSDNLNTMATVMDQTSENTTIVATGAEEINSTIQNITQNTEQVKAISSQAVNQAQNASDKMKALVDSVQAISMFTETITEISEQINLLALNATIEAARAGDYGKGFAVVANEIKELAIQTSTSSADINKQIGEVQLTTDVTVTEIDGITQVISTINENIETIASSLEEQSDTTREIAHSISRASQGIQEVNKNVSQSSVAATEISTTIAQVNQSGSEISDNSEQVNLSAMALKKMADELKVVVNRFKI